MIKSKGELVIDWVWKLCNMAFESVAVLEDRNTTVSVPLYIDKGERERELDVQTI